MGQVLSISRNGVIVSTPFQDTVGLLGARERVTRPHLQPPYPILRTARASAGPVFKGVCKQFSRSQGHGFITPENGSEDIFVHVSE